jgi:hypothetical protein
MLSVIHGKYKVYIVSQLVILHVIITKITIIIKMMMMIKNSWKQYIESVILNSLSPPKTAVLDNIIHN